MRKMLIRALGLCLLLGTSTAAMAKGISHPAHAMNAHGAITAVNAADRSVSVRTKAGAETFYVGDKATILEHGKAITISDLKSGETVQVSYTRDGSRLEASRVTVETKTASAHVAKPGKSGRK